MKKSIIVFMTVVALMTLSSQAFAVRYDKRVGISYQIVVGTIVSIDKTKNLFVVKDDDGKTHGFMAWAADIASLNQGDHVAVTAETPGAIAREIVQ